MYSSLPASEVVLS